MRLGQALHDEIVGQQKLLPAELKAIHECGISRRTAVSLGAHIPALNHEERPWQQHEAVRQKVDAAGT